jgi:hypothetical protein
MDFQLVTGGVFFCGVLSDFAGGWEKCWLFQRGFFVVDLW